MRWRRIKSALVVFGITVVMTALVGEVGLRVIGFSAPPFYRHDDRAGWTHRPGVEARYEDEGSALVRTSTAGLRDVEHDLAKPAGVYRIAILGDSFAEALQVDQEVTFWARLQEELGTCPNRRDRRVEVINFGVSSYGTANELVVLEQRAFAYAPDLVVTTFFSGNDLQDNHPKLDHLRVPIRPYFRVEGEGLALTPPEPLDLKRRAWAGILPVSRIAQVAERVRKRRSTGAAAQPAGHEAGVPRELFALTAEPEWLETWVVTERLLRRMSDEVRAHQARFLLVAIATGIAVNPDDGARTAFARDVASADLFYVDHRIGDIAQRAAIDFLALGPPMLDEAKRRNRCLHGFPNADPCGGHWNADGHRLAGALVAKKICELWSPEREAEAK